jgi:chromate transporter
METPLAARLRPKALFLGFFRIGMLGFGGVLPIARLVVVEERRWLSQAEFNDLFALCQSLPGANVTNLSAVFGYQQAGLAGAAAALSGLLAAPVGIVMAMTGLYLRYGGLAPVRHALAGMAAVAAGLMLATAVKMARPVFKARRNVAVAALVLLAVLGFKLPLPLTMLLLLPLSLYMSWRATP